MSAPVFSLPCGRDAATTPVVTVSLGVVGRGNVGAALLDQIAAAAPRLARHSNLHLRLSAVADSQRMHLTEGQDPPVSWRERFDDAAACDLNAFTEHVRAAHLPHAAIIDCSASPKVADRYADWLAAGIHVITPNKQAGAGPLARWRRIRTAAMNGGARLRYEATVCAGLPVISTLRDLLDTGDDLVGIDGILSGTLAWLFNRYDGTQPFSDLVREAHRLGYTEPDPRDDLSGTDVARKLVILAREAGHELDVADVRVESLVLPELSDIPLSELLARLDTFDEMIRERHARATSTGNVLRYVARLDRSGARVGLMELPLAHPFAHLRLTDNVVQFTTRRYCDNPLTVQGPGAGPEVTAAAVFADLLRVGASLGAQL